MASTTISPLQLHISGVGMVAAGFAIGDWLNLCGSDQPADRWAGVLEAVFHSVAGIGYIEDTYLIVAQQPGSAQSDQASDPAVLVGARNWS